MFDTTITSHTAWLRATTFCMATVKRKRNGKCSRSITPDVHFTGEGGSTLRSREMNMQTKRVDWKWRTWKWRLSKSRGVKMQDMKLNDQIATHGNAIYGNDGPICRTWKYKTYFAYWSFMFIPCIFIVQFVLQFCPSTSYLAFSGRAVHAGSSYKISKFQFQSGAAVVIEHPILTSYTNSREGGSGKYSQYLSSAQRFR